MNIDYVNRLLDEAAVAARQPRRRTFRVAQPAPPASARVAQPAPPASAKAAARSFDEMAVLASMSPRLAAAAAPVVRKLGGLMPASALPALRKEKVFASGPTHQKKNVQLRAKVKR